MGLVASSLYFRRSFRSIVPLRPKSHDPLNQWKTDLYFDKQDEDVLCIKSARLRRRCNSEGDSSIEVDVDGDNSMTNTSFDDDRSATAESIDGNSNQELLQELETLKREKKRLSDELCLVESHCLQIARSVETTNQQLRIALKSVACLHSLVEELEATGKDKDNQIEELQRENRDLTVKLKAASGEIGKAIED